MLSASAWVARNSTTRRRPFYKTCLVLLHRLQVQVTPKKQCERECLLRN